MSRLLEKYMGSRAGLFHMWISPQTPLVLLLRVDKFQDGTDKKEQGSNGGEEKESKKSSGERVSCDWVRRVTSLRLVSGYEQSSATNTLA